MADRAPPADVAQLVADYHAALFGYAYRLTGSVADAEDLTQQVFLVAQAHVDQLPQIENVKAWLFTVLRNAYLKTRRQALPQPIYGMEMDVENLPENLPEETEVDPERLQAALDRLPDEFRVVLLMYYFEERPYREIAAELQLPMGTVMSRLSRAKGHLRGLLLEGSSAGRRGRTVRIGG